MIPEVGKYYNCFDDGKISHSRMYKVYIYKIMSKEDFLSDPEAAELWAITVDNYEYLFDKNCDTFIAGVSEELTVPRIEIFAKTKDGGWFGLGELKYNDIDDIYYSDCYWCSGRLDVDGSLFEQLQHKFDK